MDITLWKEGLVLTAIGMGTVFFFLTLMIFIMRLNEIALKLLNKYFPEDVPEVKTLTKKNVDVKNDEIALAVACALRQRNNA